MNYFYFYFNHFQLLLITCAFFYVCTKTTNAIALEKFSTTPTAAAKLSCPLHPIAKENKKPLNLNQPWNLKGDGVGLDPEIFSVFKYLGFGFDVTRISLFSNESQRNYSTIFFSKNISQLLVFRNSSHQFAVPETNGKVVMNVPDFVDGKPSGTALLYSRVHLFDNWTELINSSLFQPSYTDALIELPFNFSTQYRQANSLGVVAAQTTQVRSVFDATVKDTILIDNLPNDFFGAVKKMDVFSKFDSASKDVFYNFFSTWGTHMVRKIGYGGRLYMSTLIEPNYLKNVTRENVTKYLTEMVVLKNEIKILKNFTNFSRSLFNSYGSVFNILNSKNLSVESHQAWYSGVPWNVAPISLKLEPIYNLFINHTQVSPKTWAEALDTYLFESYELPSIQEILTAFEGDARSELCADIDTHLRGVHNIRFTKQYLEMKPFPNRSLPLYTKEPGGYRDRIFWHLGHCIPTNRAMFRKEGDPIPDI